VNREAKKKCDFYSHFSLIFDSRGRLLATGENYFISKDNKFSSVHAEVDVVKKFVKTQRKKGVKKIREKLTLVVCRAGRNSFGIPELRMSKPCMACQTYLTRRGSFISEVIFSTGVGDELKKL
jgi:hypothetical protein